MSTVTPVADLAEGDAGGGSDPRLLAALASLNQIGATINRLAPGHPDSIASTLSLIVESAIKVLPGASAVIYAYDQEKRTFEVRSRVSAGELSLELGSRAVSDAELWADLPRSDGIGARAMHLRRRVLSYEEPDLEIHPAKVRAGAQAMACFPLEVAGQSMGALYVYLHHARTFSRFELLMLDNFVNQAAMAMYQQRRLVDVRRDLSRKEDELSRLRHAGLLISSRLGVDETLDAILHMALEVTGAHYGIFRLLDESERHLITRAVAGETQAGPLVEALPLDSTSIMGWVAEHRQPLCIHDLQAAPWVQIYHPLYANLKMRSELAVPLIGSSWRLEGVLNLESPHVGAFSEQDSLLLQSLATQAVIAIQEARLLDALQEVAQQLLVQSHQEVLKHLVLLACKLLNATSGAIWTLANDMLILQAASDELPRLKHLPLKGSLTGLAILEGSLVVSEDVRADGRFYCRDVAREQDWSCALIVPLLSSEDREPLGAFSVYRSSAAPGCFSESGWDEKILTCLARYAALALHGAERHKELRAAQERQAIAETFAAVGDVTANVLHHLNNKVGTIPVRIQGIQDKCASRLAEDDYLTTNLLAIERSAREAMSAVRASLSHLRPIKPAPVDVAACVSAALLSAALPDSLLVQVSGLNDLPLIAANQQTLVLLVVNLLHNADTAMQGVGTIDIAGKARAAWVEILICDDGPGIDPALHERIFEFNFSGRARPRAERLGFGLWWVKTLIFRLGGAIQVESDGVQGSCFHLRLPRAEMEA